MRQHGYLTIEHCLDKDDLLGIPSLILEEFTNIELNIIEEYEDYFVIKFICEEFEEMQDLISTVSYILIGENIYKYKVTLNYVE